MWSHQLKESSLQWQESLLAFTPGVHKWIFPPFSYSLFTMLLIKNRIMVEQTHKAESLWYASKQLSKYVQMSNHKQRSLISRLRGTGYVISLIYLYFCTILWQNKHLHLSRDYGLSKYTNNHVKASDIFLYTQWCWSHLFSFSNIPREYSIYQTYWVRLSNQVQD